MPLLPSLAKGVINQSRRGLDSAIFQIKNRSIHRPRGLHVAPKAFIRRQDSRLA
jgi:hypothetical protein